MSMLPWQLRLTDLFSAFPPEQIQRREVYWHDGDMGVHNADQNMALRFRDYTSDGHSYRQEAVLAAGQNVGTYMTGNDRVGDSTSHLTYADVITQSAQTLNLKVPPGALLWNSVPFNPLLNPTNNMPLGLATAEDAFQLAAGSIPGASSLEALQDQLASIQTLTGDILIDGDVDFTSPFAAFCSLTSQKLPLLNFGSILLLQAFMKGLPLFLSTVPGAPVAPSPLLLSILPLCKMTTTTAYTASVEGVVVGEELQSFLLSSVPGLGAAFS